MKNKEQEHRRINNHTIRKNNNDNKDQIAIKPQRTIPKQMKPSKWRTKNTNKEHWTRTLINGKYEEIKTPEHDGRTTSKEQGHEQATTTNNHNKNTHNNK